MTHVPANPARTLGALLILAHGAGAGERHPFMVRMARGLAERGVDVVTFDFPYMQAKRRAPDKAPVLEASYVEVIRDARRQPALAGHRLFVGGKSMGGRMATHLAANWADRGTDAALDGVVLLGYPLHPPGKPDQPRVAHLPAITAPMLIVQGARDTFGTADEIRAAIAGLRAPITLHVIEQGDHSLAVPRSAGVPQAAVYEDVLDRIASWIQSV